MTTPSDPAARPCRGTAGSNARSRALFLASQAALAVLEIASEPCTGRVLERRARAYGIQPSNTRTAMSRLWKAGYLTRTSPGHGAPYLVSGRGTDLLGVMRADLRPGDARVLVCLSAEPMHVRAVQSAVPDLSRTHAHHRLKALIGLGLVRRVSLARYALTGLGEFALPEARALIHFLEAV